jgi:hypothetical protein
MLVFQQVPRVFINTKEDGQFDLAVHTCYVLLLIICEHNGFIEVVGKGQ